MSLIAKDLPTLLFLLMPGFMAAGIFYTLTAHPKTSEFERLVQSLIFTTLVRVGLIGIKPSLFWLGQGGRSWGPWSENVELVWSVVIAFILGLVFASLANSDAFHKLMLWCKISNRTFHPSEWYGVFKREKRTILLHLSGDRRLRGFATEWPDQPGKGHLVIHSPAWVLDDGSISEVHEADSFLVSASDVEMVEFLKKHDEVKVEPSVVAAARQLLIDDRKPKGETEDGGKGTSESA